MTREQAIRKARAVVGPRAILEVRSFVSSPDKRAEAKAEADRHEAERDCLRAEIDRRMREAGIYELQARSRKAHEARADALHRAGWLAGYRFHINRATSSIGSEVLGYGDTWEEAIAMAEARITTDTEERAAAHRARVEARKAAR